MGPYDIQNYLNYMAQQLAEENSERAAMTDRATRIQDNYLYRKEAKRRPGGYRTPQGDKPPRADKRKLPNRKNKPASKRVVEDNQRKAKEIMKNSEDKEATQDSNNMQHLLQEKADTFSVPALKGIDFKDVIQKESWFNAIEKVAGVGQLVLNNGVPNYPLLAQVYLRENKHAHHTYMVNNARNRRGKN